MQATAAVLHAQDSIYHTSKLRRDWDLLWNTSSRVYLIIQHTGTTAKPEGIGVQLSGRTKLHLRLARVAGSGLHVG